MPVPTKPYKTYDEQADLLQSRGMDIGDRSAAIDQLRQVNYYRLSGYWYPFRRLVNQSRSDQFYGGTTLADVVSLYNFDANLRSMTLAVLAPIELAVRALLGHELGELHECAHLDVALLGPRARGPEYTKWLRLYNEKLSDSREDFVRHHNSNYAGVLPVWAAVEVLDWGGLTRLYGLSSRPIQDSVADHFGLRGPQFETWLKSLNVVRNVCAHHGRFFNRVFALAPRLPAAGLHPALDTAGPYTRTFGQLTLVQHLLDASGAGRPTVLPRLFRAFPAVASMPVSHTGAPTGWEQNRLWQVPS